MKKQQSFFLTLAKLRISRILTARLRGFQYRFQDTKSLFDDNLEQPPLFWLDSSISNRPVEFCKESLPC